MSSERETDCPGRWPGLDCIIVLEVAINDYLTESKLERLAAKHCDPGRRGVLTNRSGRDGRDVHQGVGMRERQKELRRQRFRKEQRRKAAIREMKRKRKVKPSK